MGEYLARSGDSQRGIPPQTYREHISDVVSRGERNADRLLSYCRWQPEGMEYFRGAIYRGGWYHDLGKLDPKNQNVLSKDDSHEPLPVRHADAATAYLFQEKKVTIPLLLAYSHHIGLPDILKEKCRGEYAFRLYGIHDKPNKKAYVDQHWEEYLTIHEQILGKEKPTVSHKRKWNGLPVRLALSCLVDADYHSAARHRGKEKEILPAHPRWEERLASLDRYVKGLQKDAENSHLLTDVYQTCRNATFEDAGMLECSSSVGTGKTTAVMAWMLQEAIRCGLRHLFVILPYTNIIQQAVDVYREALVLPGENPELVVAELHHQADFSQPENFAMAAVWNTPVIVTTAVQFFETLASNKPSVLRKLHELPGSAIFVDEAHAALPLHLWKQEFLWLKQLTQDWGCRAVLASGSLNKFWENTQMFPEKTTIPSLLPRSLMERLEIREKGRVKFCRIQNALNLSGIVDRIIQDKGISRLVIVNTVSSAVAIARALKKKGVAVRHLSAALTPRDRERILVEIRDMRNPESPRFTKDCVLVATSCVEAGVDISFDRAYRECCSVTSLIQVAGRINRYAEQEEPAIVYSFRLLQGDGLVLHPDFAISAGIVDELFEEGYFEKRTEIEWVQEAFYRENQRIKDRYSRIIEMEKAQNYPEVAQLCKVIDSDTQLVVVDSEILSRLEHDEPVSSRELQRNSVSIRTEKAKKIGLPVQGHDEIWKLREEYTYDTEWGYMAKETTS